MSGIDDVSALAFQIEIAKCAGQEGFSRAVSGEYQVLGMVCKLSIQGEDWPQMLSRYGKIWLWLRRCVHARIAPLTP
jgi:hypothetical protein